MSSWAIANHPSRPQQQTTEIGAVGVDAPERTQALSAIEKRIRPWGGGIASSPNGVRTRISTLRAWSGSSL
jgi:hypothetical protein